MCQRAGEGCTDLHPCVRHLLEAARHLLLASLKSASCACAASGQELAKSHPGQHGVNGSEEANRAGVHLPPAGAEGGQVTNTLLYLQNGLTGALHSSENTKVFFCFF